jgi:hypothetical protein
MTEQHLGITSPDGRFAWDGRSWIPTGQAAATVAATNVAANVPPNNVNGGAPAHAAPERSDSSAAFSVLGFIFVVARIILFSLAGVHFLHTGTVMQGIVSEAGDTTAEAFYQAMGLFSNAIALVCFAAAVPLQYLSSQVAARRSAR